MQNVIKAFLQWPEARSFEHTIVEINISSFSGPTISHARRALQRSPRARKWCIFPCGKLGSKSASVCKTRARLAKHAPKPQFSADSASRVSHPGKMAQPARKGAAGRRRLAHEALHRLDARRPVSDFGVSGTRPLCKRKIKTATRGSWVSTQSPTCFRKGRTIPVRAPLLWLTTIGLVTRR